LNASIAYPSAGLKKRSSPDGENVLYDVDIESLIDWYS